MKKTLIASAVALATFASAGVNAAEANLPTVYGNIQLVLKNVNVDSDNAATDDSYYEHADNGSTIGFSHEHEIMPGLTGFAKAEFEFNADELKRGGLDEGDQAFLGLKGDFGLVKVGSYDTIYDDAVGDVVYDFFEAVGDVYNLNATNEGDTVTYYSPNMGGLQVAAALQINGEEDNSRLNPNKARNSLMAVVSYEMGDTKLAFAWDSAENGHQNGVGSGLPGVSVENVYALSLTHAMGDIKLNASYEMASDIADIASISAIYSMGANQFAAAYQLGMPDVSGAEDSNAIILQALHNLSSNMYVYVEGEWVDNLGGVDGDERTTLALGATYVF